MPGVLNVGRKAEALLRELQRSRWLPPYNEKLTKEVIDEIGPYVREMKVLGDQMQELRQQGEMPTEPVTAGFCLYNDLIERNKRCMLAYLNFRLQRIEELRWEVGLHVPPEKMRNLHEEEKQYLYLYNAALDKYMRNYSRNSKETLDLTADAYPPEDLNVQIRSIDDDVGEIATVDSGTLKLKKGWVHTVRRTDVEQLIRAGKVEHLGTLKAGDTF